MKWLLFSFLEDLVDLVAVEGVDLAAEFARGCKAVRKYASG